MKCPRCNSVKNIVVDSRSKGYAQRRVRECQECGERFVTAEHYAVGYNVEQRGMPEWLKEQIGKQFTWGKEKI